MTEEVETPEVVDEDEGKDAKPIDPLEKELQEMKDAEKKETALAPSDNAATLPAKAEKAGPGDFIVPHVQQFLETAGKFTPTEKEKLALMEPIEDADIEIRPDGLIFPGWHWCADRMDEVFGPGVWTLTPLAKPSFVNNVIYAPFALYVRGSFAGYAMGEQRYHPNNDTMTYGDAAEGAKSNALLRLCKPLIPGMRHMWKQDFIAYWKAEYAEAYKAGNKVLWRKKGTPPNGAELFEFLAEMKKCKANLGDKDYYVLLEEWGYKKASQVKNDKQRVKMLSYFRSKAGINPYKEMKNGRK